MKNEKALVWFRRDLRDHDHAALSAALAAAGEVYCAFVFDSEILDALPTRTDRRVHFIHESLRELDVALRSHGGGLIVRHGRARDEIPALARQLGVAAVYANRDYEPAAKQRDDAVAASLAAVGIAFHDFKDQAIFARDEVLTQAGRPFSVFTPYKNAWLKRLTAADMAAYPCAGRLAGSEMAAIPELTALGFATTGHVGLGDRLGFGGARVGTGVTSSGWRNTSSARARLGRRRMKPRSSRAEISRCTPDLLFRSSASFISSKLGEMPVSSSLR